MRDRNVTCGLGVSASSHPACSVMTIALAVVRDCTGVTRQGRPLKIILTIASKRVAVTRKRCFREVRMECRVPGKLCELCRALSSARAPATCGDGKGSRRSTGGLD